MKSEQALAALIDHTLLKPESTADMVERLCDEAIQYNFCSVCVLPVFVTQAAQCLKGSSVKVCTVIGFPLGANETRVKEVETEIALQQGADEVDMVLNIGFLKARAYEKLGNDISAVVVAAKGKTVKVILETCLLTDEEKIAACKICAEAGVNFVKTSTGFSTSGATLEDVRLMRESVGPHIGVKASGGIRDYASACAMIEAGATRLGTSSGVLIVNAAKDMSDSS